MGENEYLLSVDCSESHYITPERSTPAIDSDRLMDVFQDEVVKAFVKMVDFKKFARSGHGLCLDESEIQSIIEDNQSSVYEQKIQLLVKWTENKGTAATAFNIRSLVNKFKDPDPDSEDEDIQQEPHHESLPVDLSGRVHENSSNKIMKQERKLLDCSAQRTLFNNVHYWSDLPVLPALEGTQCVLAQNISRSNSIQKVTLHFQNKKRSGGGPIKCFIRMVDGLLVVFNDIKNSESCLNTINQSLDGKKISILKKVIPEYYTNKFVLEVVGESKTFDHETLELYLESCSPNETSPTSCNEQEKSGVYLIEYGNDYDYSETEELLQKIHSKPLEGKSLKAAPLLKTDCLKVIGVTSDISNDAMRLLFENRKRTNGGPVTRIDRLKTQSALVYFCSYIVAGRVHQKLGGDMKICKHPVKLELYHHSVSNDHNDNIIINFQQTSGHQQESGHVPEAQLGSFLLTPSCDETILHFLSGNRSHAEKLKQFFINIAEVKFMFRSDLQLEFTPLKDWKESKENFSTHCEKNVNKFLSGYATVSSTFERSRLDRARSQDLYPEIKQRYRRNGVSDDIIVCWKSNEPVVRITGLKSSVEQMSKQIENHVNSVVVRTQSNQRQFRTYCYCGIVDEIRKMYPDVKIEIDEKNFVLELTGLESMVYTANMQAMTMHNEIDKKRLTGLDESIYSFILGFLSHKSDLDMKLNKKFKSAGIRGVIELNGDELCLKVKPNEDYKKAVEVIRQFIIVEEIGTDESESRVVTSSSWREFQQKLQKGLYSIHVTSNKNIVMIGLREDLKLLKEKIMNFLDENSLKTFSLPMAYGRARYILEQSYEFSQKSCENKEIECGLTPDNGGGIFVKGKKRALAIAISEAQKLQGKILEVMHCLNEPGIRQHYQSSDGLSFIKSTELLTECIIITISPDCEEWVEFNKGVDKPYQTAITQSSAVDIQEYKLASYIFNSVELSVWKTDIIKHKCDVIVNGSNPELELGGGISGAIRARDEKNGNGQIQKELNAIIRKKYGSILAGDAVITSAGNLPACKKIVHAVGPRWNNPGGDDPKLILKASVSNSLKLVDDAGLKSIAFPAISCGVFGGAVDVCIHLIQEAVYDYFATTQNSGIKEVHFVENGRQDILDAFSKFPENKMQQKQTTPAHTGHVQSVHGGISQQVAPTVKVQLVQGDIVSYQAFNAAFNLTTPNVTGSQSFPSQSPNVGVRSKKRSHSFVIDNSTNSNFNLSVGALARLSEEKAEDSSFWMFFYATNLEDIDKAIGYISHETGKEMKKQFIDDDVIGRLTKWENFEIDEIRKTRNVTIDNKSTGYLNRLVFIGLTTEVMEALLQVIEILRKLRDAENCASYVTWQKKTSNNWENYLPRSAHVLETAYQAHLKKKTNNAPEKVKVPEFKKGAVTYHSIDISSLFDKNNQSPPKVRRQPTERSASDLPASWDEMKKGTPSTRIILRTDSQEYQNVLTKFQADGVFNSSIVSIERIQNISLHKQYIAKKAEVTEKLKNFPKPIEQQLFHGTGNDDDILIHGFDRSFAGKHATAYGRGVYFASRASYSHGYAAPKQNGHRRMFLADVITGDYCAGNANFVAPPNRANTNLKNDLYDSVVDNVMAPTIYVIFKDSSAYPTYLITYT